MDSPLDGIRVLDFGSFIAGPFCAALLGDFGADVIRVERLSGGNDRRLIPLPEEYDGDGALYMQLNRNKRSLALDMACDDGRRIVRELIAAADVVIANLPRRVLIALGLDYDTLQALRPEIILCTCTAYGGDDASKDRFGFDGIGQAMSGAMHMTAGQDGTPRKAYAHYVDFSTAALSAFGVALALLERNRSDRGQLVELSLLRTAMTMMNSTIIEEATTNPARRGSGNRSQFAGPSDTLRATDGWILVQIAGGAMFRKWATLVERPEWVDDPRFLDDAARGRNGAVLSARMAEWCGERSTGQCLAELAAVSIPAAPIIAPSEVLEHPDIIGGDLLQPVTRPGSAEALPIAKPPLEMSKAAGRIRTAAPKLGQHSGEILAELGFSSDDIDRYRHAGVISCAPFQAREDRAGPRR